MAIRFPENTEANIEETAPTYTMMQYLATNKTGFYPQYCLRGGVDIDVNKNQIYAIESIFKLPRISIYSENGQFINAFSHDELKSPYGIALHKGSIYITDTSQNLVLHFELSPKGGIHLITKLGGEGTDIGQFNLPRQLTVSTNGDVYITDCLNNRIQILDCCLNYVRQISHDTMSYPYDVKLTSAAMYVLTSYNRNPTQIYNCVLPPKPPPGLSNCVHVFSLGGDKLRSLITSGSNIVAQVSNPKFFCLDSNENLILSDSGDYPIKIFSKDGTLTEKLTIKGYLSEKLSSSSGIVLTNNRKIVLFVSKMRCGIQIYSC